MPLSVLPVSAAWRWAREPGRTGRQVVVAKSAGFCFGVERAVDRVYQQIDALKAGKAKGPIYTFGPIIHNEEVVRDLEEKGVMVLEDEAALRSLPKGQGTASSVPTVSAATFMISLKIGAWR